ncbi:MAG TPA: response regulator transcription factor [Candidatus Dormibacteraeota bacterium]|jgi:DNA-binding response OmpR family regulator|nr:response regulator transcription factor [Candidatus Dormibacteraeota bacterium]
MARVLVVEDERGLSDLVRSHLEREGHEVTQAFDGREALRIARQQSPELLVLDWMLPGLDGLEVCRELRRTHLMPVIMLTARDSETDRVLGLEAGADDYVVKPFSIPELLARVRATLRRVALDSAAIEAEAGDKPLVCGSLVLDPGGHTATLGGVRLDLTARELDLLGMLLSHPNRTFTRDYLLDRLWGPDYEGLDRAVDTQMARLRRKLGDQGRALEAVWGVGYRFRPDLVVGG